MWIGVPLCSRIELISALHAIGFGFETLSGRVTMADCILFARTDISGCRGMVMLLQIHEMQKNYLWNQGGGFFFLNFLRQHLYFCCFCNVTFFTLKVYPFFSSKLTQFHMWPKVLRPPDCLYTFASYVAQGVKTTPLSLHRNFHGAVQYSGSFFYIEKTQEIRYHV